jgi:type II secretory pathway pseudopilin PulG
MSPLAIGTLVFVCVLGGVLIGILLGSVLPKHYLSADAKDVIKVSMAMIATLAALVLGLLTASSKGALDDKESELRSMAAQVILLDRTMAQYGPETQEARDLLKRITITRISQIWPEESAGDVAPEAVGRGAGIETLQQSLLALSPQNDAQRWFLTKALQISGEIAAERWLVFEQIGTRIHWPFLVIVVFWLTIVFTSFGLFAPPSASAITALLVAALAVAGAIYLILAMDQPYSGLIKISGSPMRAALDQLGH